MVFAQSDLRRSKLAPSYVASAFVLSLLIHAVVFLALELGYQTGLWQTTWLFAKKKPVPLERAMQPAETQPQEQEMPLIFVDVDPTQAVPEAPNDAKYYSSLSSKAGNPDPSRDVLVPKIEGKQEHVPQTVERGEPEPLQAPPVPAAPAPEPPAAEPPPRERPRVEPPSPEPAPPKPDPQPRTRDTDLALAKPPERPTEAVDRQPPKPELPKRPQPRARTLEAARRQKGLPGEKMKQEGGVKRFSLDPSFDAKSTPFGAYDAAIIAAIRRRWYDLLEARDVTASYSGRVVLEFRLNSDGRVSDMRMTENGVTEILGLLCQRAVQDPAPFAPWPADLRRLVGKEYRDVRFTFYYN